MSTCLFGLRARPRFFSALFGLLVLVCVAMSEGRSETQKEEAPMLIAKRLADQSKSGLGNWLGFPIRVLMMERKMQSPFVATVHEGQCLVILNTKPVSWEAWENFRKLSGLSLRESYYFAILHEIGHCVNKLKSEFVGAAFPEGIGSELYADVFALLAARKLLDSKTAQLIASGVVQARLAQSGFFFGSTTHDTGSKLRAIHQAMLERSSSAHDVKGDEPSVLARRLVEDSLFN